jgi:hypothetical protein
MAHSAAFLQFLTLLSTVSRSAAGFGKHGSSACSPSSLYRLKYTNPNKNFILTTSGILFANRIYGQLLAGITTRTMVTTRRSKAAASSSSTSAASTKGDDSTSNTTDVDEMILGEASGRTHDHGHDPPELPAAQSNPTKRRRVKSATKPKVPVRGNARKPKGGTAIVPGSTKDEAGVTSSSEGRPWYAQFTNGDTEYDEYMKTEWGFEKVSRVGRLVSKQTLPRPLKGTICHKCFVL